MRRHKVAVIHPWLRQGGSEAVALWIIEALKRDFEVTLITAGPVELGPLNAYYGTDLREGEIEIMRAPLPPGLRDSPRLAGLRSTYLYRYCRRIASARFDLVINTYGPCDLGIPAVQCIADFAFVPEWRNVLHPELAHHRRWWYGDSPLRRSYLALCRAVHHPDPEAWKHNLTIANSCWTARLLEERFGMASQVVYPPVVGGFPEIPWEERENGFVCVGRAVPEKRMDSVIRILDRVREAGHDVHLHILGGLEDSPFGQKVKEMAARRSWAKLEGRTFGPRKKDLMAGHRFGINGRDNEPFGIAPAELVKAGCIAFVPNGGGQTEIVNHPMLTFNDEEDAARKIIAVLSSPKLQESLRAHLRESAERFSVTAFMHAIRGVVEKRLAQAPVEALCDCPH